MMSLFISEGHGQGSRDPNGTVASFGVHHFSVMVPARHDVDLERGPDRQKEEMSNLDLIMTPLSQ